VTFLGSLRRWVGRRPLDWARGAGRARGERPRGVEVIIPVYGAADALRACLASVAGCTDLRRHRVVLVIDGPQDETVESVIARCTFATILRNETRRGFAGAVNRGMRESVSDVVLLNSDTIVTPGWLEKLIDAAVSSGDIGTVTPLSNHATLCSVPRAFERNLLPNGHDAASFNALIERVSERAYPRIPTGVGFCLYVRRALIDDIGLFDEAAFPRGYGEEDDFCFRALAKGWLHVIDDATFVEHAGGASFGASASDAARAGAATLRRLQVRHRATIAAYMRRDPAAAVRARITDALGVKRDARPRVVHLVHGWPPFQHAGTELYASWLVRQQQATRHVAVYTRGADPARAEGEAVEWIDRGVRVRIVTNHFTWRNPLRRNALRDRALERDFARFLDEERPELLHIHHLAGHTFSLARVARRLGIPIVLQLHDWWFLCARVNLFDKDGKRCSGPAFEKCAACATLTRVPPAALTNRAMHALRKRATRAAIAAADVCVCGSHAIRDAYVRDEIVPASTPIHVIPYGVDIAPLTELRPRAQRPIRFGYVGSLLPHKGVHTAVEAMRAFTRDEAELHVWGSTAASPEYVASLRRGAGGAAVTFEGPFGEAEKSRVFASMDVLLVPSIGLESFGLAPREAMMCGVPVIASAGAALDEMFEPGTCGEFFPAADVEALRAILRRVVDSPELIEQWASRLPAPKRADAHAQEIARVYDEVLAARR
jgi:glycosyltransferase involved in cell wall biosynthesis/GT2 family glycosyltransferase